MDNLVELEPSNNLTEEQKAYWWARLAEGERKVAYAQKMLGIIVTEEQHE